MKEKPHNLVITEEGIFHTIQGEGKFIGTPSLFVRMAGCNLRCCWRDSQTKNLNLCDSPHSSFNAIGESFHAVDIAARILSKNCKHVVITGGEPFLFPALSVLISKLVSCGRFVTVETNGTRYFNNVAQFLSISPKLSSSSAHPSMGSEHEAERFNHTALRLMMLNHDYQMKFVVDSENDIKEVLQYQDMLGIPSDRIYLMPQGMTVEEINNKMEWAIEAAKVFGFIISDRLHIRIWGNKKGV